MKTMLMGDRSDYLFSSPDPAGPVAHAGLFAGLLRGLERVGSLLEANPPDPRDVGARKLNDAHWRVHGWPF